MDTPLPGSKRALLILAGVSALVITEYGKSTYRPYAWSHSLRDFGLADSLPSLGGTITGTLLLTGVFARGRNAAGRTALGIGGGSLLYEFLQPTLRTGIFDWTDVLFVLLGTGIGWLAVKAILGDLTALLRPNPSLRSSPSSTE
jgi:hypothetical protein